MSATHLTADEVRGRITAMGGKPTDVYYPRSIPDHLLSQFCSRLNPGHEGRVIGWVYDEERNLWVCSACDKPAKGTAWMLIEYCLTCDEEYVAWKHPDRNLECKACLSINAS